MIINEYNRRKKLGQNAEKWLEEKLSNKDFYLTNKVNELKEKQNG
jgi:hypothetical protein